VDSFCAGDFGEFDALSVARFETDGGAGRNIQAHAEGLRAIEAEFAIGFEEMEMGADLDGPVTGIDDVEFDYATVRVGDHGLGSEAIFPGDHLRFSLSAAVEEKTHP
jgi:hypothetical protein